MIGYFPGNIKKGVILLKFLVRLLRHRPRLTRQIQYQNNNKVIKSS